MLESGAGEDTSLRPCSVCGTARQCRCGRRCARTASRTRTKNRCNATHRLCRFGLSRNRPYLILLSDGDRPPQPTSARALQSYARNTSSRVSRRERCLSRQSSLARRLSLATFAGKATNKHQATSVYRFATSIAIKRIEIDASASTPD